MVLLQLLLLLRCFGLGFGGWRLGGLGFGGAWGGGGWERPVSNNLFQPAGWGGGVVGGWERPVSNYKFQPAGLGVGGGGGGGWGEVGNVLFLTTSFNPWGWGGGGGWERPASKYMFQPESLKQRPQSFKFEFSILPKPRR